jgi:hypothetical protein
MLQGLRAGDLTFPPVYVELRILVHVPEGLLEAHRVLAAGAGRIEHPLVREPLNPFVDPALPRRVLPEAREMEPPLPVEIPVDDAGGIEVVHRGHESARVRNPELPAAPQVGGTLQRPVLSAFGEPCDLPRGSRVLADSQAILSRVVRVTKRVSKGWNTAYEHLPEDAAIRRAIHPRCEGFARRRSGVLRVPGESVRQRAALSSSPGRGRL